MPDGGQATVYVGVTANPLAEAGEPNASEPRYRLTYSLAADGILKGSFELAAAESPDDFKPLFSWSARKLK